MARPVKVGDSVMLPAGHGAKVLVTRYIDGGERSGRPFGWIYLHTGRDGRGASFGMPYPSTFTRAMLRESAPTAVLPDEWTNNGYIEARAFLTNAPCVLR